jgi:hypothetical protein
MALKIPVYQKPVYQQNEQRYGDCVRQSFFPSLNDGHGCLNDTRFTRSGNLAMLAAIRRASSWGSGGGRSGIVRLFCVSPQRRSDDRR